MDAPLLLTRDPLLPTRSPARGRGGRAAPRGSRRRGRRPAGLVDRPVVLVGVDLAPKLARLGPDRPGAGARARSRRRSDLPVCAPPSSWGRSRCSRSAPTGAAHRGADRLGRGGPRRGARSRWSAARVGRAPRRWPARWVRWRPRPARRSWSTSTRWVPAPTGCWGLERAAGVAGAPWPRTTGRLSSRALREALPAARGARGARLGRRPGRVARPGAVREVVSAARPRARHRRASSTAARPRRHHRRGQGPQRPRRGGCVCATVPGVTAAARLCDRLAAEAGGEGGTARPVGWPWSCGAGP